ncbi:MAG: BACON domain-containing protein, partial [Cryobacterium sp.]
MSDPRIAEFDPSPDHWQTLEYGEPAVVRYELCMYMLGASAPFATVDMGKGSPGADGKIRFDFASRVAAWPLTGGYCEARVAAIGPEGAALSDASNPFTFGTASACATSLSATSLSVPALGGSYTLHVTTGTGCAWTASTYLSWATMWISGGSGGGPVPFAVKQNPSTSSRSGTITIAGKTVTVRQDGLSTSPATYQLTVTRPPGGTVYSAGIRCGTAGTLCQVTMSGSMSLGL